MFEVGKYAFWGLLAWIGIALVAQLGYLLYLKIRTRETVLNKIGKMHDVLAEGFKDVEKARRAYQALLDDAEDARSAEGSKRLH